MLLYSLTLGFMDFLAYYLLTHVSALGLRFTLSESLHNDNIDINFLELFVLVILSVPMGLVVSFVTNKYWIQKLAKKLGVSNKFGDADVWSLIMHRESADWWIVVRDLEADLAYEGWVNEFSDTTDNVDEILLTDVRVYKNSTAEFLYEVPAVYLADQRGKRIVEFPHF